MGPNGVKNKWMNLGRGGKSQKEKGLEYTNV